MKRIVVVLMSMVLLLTLACGCQKEEVAETDSLPETLDEYIHLSELVQVPEVEPLAVYTTPFEMLDGEAFIGTVISDSDLTVNDLSAEGIMTIYNQTDYLSIVVNDFMLYRNFFLRQKGSGYDEYDEVLSQMSFRYPDSKGGLRNYAYAPEEYLVNQEEEEGLEGIISQGIDLAGTLEMPLESHPFRAEYLDGSIFTALELDPNDYSISPFYRLFWNFQIEGVPVLGPEYSLTRSGKSTGDTVLLPYMEMLIDQEGIQHATGMSCITHLEETGTLVEPQPVQEALNTFQEYFSDLILTEETQIEIQDIQAAYVAVKNNMEITLEPAWVIVYEQSGAMQCMAVSMSTGEMM